MPGNKRGFAAMKEEGREEEVSEIASMGGTAAHESGNANEFDSEEAREAGRKGGKSQGQENNPRNFTNLSEDELSQIASKGGRKSRGGR